MSSIRFLEPIHSMTSRFSNSTSVRKIPFKLEILTFLFCVFLFLYLYGWKYLSQKIVLGGDTQLLWSPLFLFYYSMKHFHEIAWWDPTGINGWPIFYYMSSAAYSVLSPIAFFSALIFIALNFITDINVNGFVIFQQTVYCFSLSLIAVLLISRELISRPLARFFVPLVFTLSSIPVGGFRDSYMASALPAALFYVFAWLHFNRARTAQSLYILLFFTGLFLSNLSYSVALSSLYWTILFTAFMLIANPSLLASLFSVMRDALRTTQGKILLISGLLMCVAALIFALTPVMMFSNEFVRVPAGPAFNYYDPNDGWAPPYFGAPTYELWRMFLAWMPLREFHDVLFQSDIWKAGMDHWYIGLATLPLILVAFVLKAAKKYVLMLILIAFICMVFIPYVFNNLFFLTLMENFKFFHNVRTMPGLLPRDGPLLFLIIVAGMGLDVILRTPIASRLNDKSSDNHGLRMITTVLLLGFVFLGAACMIAGMTSKLPNSYFKDLRHGMTHLGVYLSLFSILCAVMLYVNQKTKKYLVIAFFVFTITDLTISSSYYWNQGKVWYANGGPHTLPNPKEIGPITSENEHWAQLHAGVFHHIFIDPFLGNRAWITLATRPKQVGYLENWNRETRRVTEYPSFRYFTNGRYTPFESIKEIDTIATPEKGNWFYLHDSDLVKNKPTPEKIDVKQNITKFTFNEIRMDVSSPKAAFMVFNDNYSPYWEAKVNGKRVPITRANFSYKAIEIPAGDSTIEWLFNPYPEKIVMSVFYIIFLTFIFSFFYYIREGRKKTKASISIKNFGESRPR